MNRAEASVYEMNRRMLKGTRVCLAAEVIEVFIDDLSVDVKPLFEERILGNSNRDINFEEMQSIIVAFADICGVRKIPQQGDHGVLLFHDFDLDVYLKTRERKPVPTARFHDYNDAIFIPMEIAAVNRPEPLITIAGGKVIINAPDGIELNGIDWETHIHPTPAGVSGSPQSP